VLLACDDYLSPRVSARMRALWHGGLRVIPFKPVGRTIWLGPIFSPPSTPACWTCLEHRLERNRPVEAYLAAASTGDPVRAAPPVALPVTMRLAASLTALKLAELATDPARSPLLKHLVTVDLSTLEQRVHAVARRPQCPACGDGSWMNQSIAAPIRLDRVLRLQHADGGHRVVGPDETFKQCAHLVSPITGAVARLEPHQERDHPHSSVYVGGYFLRPAAGQALATETFFRPSLGKGRTAVQARSSALAEAIERYASLWQGDEPTVTERLCDLPGEAIDPRGLLNFSEKQFRERDPLGDPRHNAPAPFTAETVIAWTPCWSLTADSRRYLPTSYCFNQASRDAAFCPFDPNGHAAGNCREEAVLQGFLELVERDAVGIWWYNRLQKPGIDLDSAGGDLPVRMRDHYQSLGWRLWALDLTTDLEIPSIAAVAYQEASGRFLAGFGCHLDSTIALHRAITELNQIFDPDPNKPALWAISDLPDPRFVFPHIDRPGRRLRDLPGRDFSDLRSEIEYCVSQAERRGLETIVLDYTRPDLVLSTVKVVVPGLRHFWRRLGAGRLYEVPVALGELERALREEELNPLTLRV
jgi:bacteriocin biosynthesis cyclodehydratase domain-containing protein